MYRIFIMIIGVFITCMFSISAFATSFEEVQAKANQRDVKAQYRLAYLYANGKGVEKNMLEAVKWYTKVAEKGHKAAQYRLATMYYTGKDIVKNDAEALKWYTKVAAQGDATSQKMVDELQVTVKAQTEKIQAENDANSSEIRTTYYDNGNVKEKTTYKGDKKHGEEVHYHANGKVDKIVIYENGVNVVERAINHYHKKDYAEAAKWLRKAAENGHMEAQSLLADIYANGNGVKKNDVEATKWYIKAGNQGHMMAQFNLGDRYANGIGVEKSYHEAAKWYKKAAEQGNVWSQNHLGDMYANSDLYYNIEGFPKNYDEAKKWYGKSAAQGNMGGIEGLENLEKGIVATNSLDKISADLGVMRGNRQYENKNYVEAIKSYKEAGGYGSIEAQYNIGIMYYRGEGVKKDYAEAAKWLRKAAENGHMEAQYTLGFLYDNNPVGKKDYAEAAKWYRKASEQGNDGAQNNLGVLYANGRGVKKDYDEATKWYRKAIAQGNTYAEGNLASLKKNQQKAASASSSSSRGLLNVNPNTIGDYQLREYAKTGDCGSFYDGEIEAICEGGVYAQKILADKYSKEFSQYMFDGYAIFHGKYSDIGVNHDILFGTGARLTPRQRGDWLMYILKGVLVGG